MLLLASMEGLHDAEGPVRLERHGGDPWVESPATIAARRGDTILAAAERVVEARGGGAGDGRVEESSVVLLHLHGIGAVHGGRHVRRQREAQPAAAADRRVAPAGAAAAEVLAAVAGHFGETRRAAGREEVVGRRDDERSIIGEYMPQ